MITQDQIPRRRTRKHRYRIIDSRLLCIRRRRICCSPVVSVPPPPRRLALFLLACLAWRSPQTDCTGGGAHPSVPLFALAADVVISDHDDDSPPDLPLEERKLKVVTKPGAAEVGVPPSNAKRAVNSALRRVGSPGASADSSSLPMAAAGQTLSQILAKAAWRGLGGGIPGFVAGVIQVLTLMWLRTVINYQCRYGTTFRQAMNTLFNEGGIPRFYHGLGFALIQAPLARFMATAANDGVETLLASLEFTKSWGAGRGTLVSSIVVAAGRVLLMPIDTCKTVLQVDSADGFRNLMRKVKAGKIGLLYQGMLALAASSAVGYYPWFFTYNFLSKSATVQILFRAGILRNAFIGFVASVVSDVISNCIRVVKTTKQSLAAKHTMSYGEVVNVIVAADGWKGLFGRGLKTRILANAIQSVLFTIVWRGLADRWRGGDSNKGSSLDIKDEDTDDDGGES